MPHVSQFRRLWAELHRRPLSGIRYPVSEMKWLRHFANRIPCGYCRHHWLEVTANLPPPFSRHSSQVTRHSYFSWTVRAHNAINHRLGKPIMTLGTARRAWGFDTPG